MQTQRCRLLFSLLFTFSLFHLSPTPAAAFPAGTFQLSDVDFIRQSCNNTSYPDICYSSLSPYARNVQQSQERLVRVSIAVSHSRLKQMAAYISSLLRRGSPDPQVIGALQICSEVFADALEEMEESLNRMRNSRSRSISPPDISDIQTWISAALSDENDCIDGFNESVPDGPEKADVINRTVEALKYVSNVLVFVAALSPPVGNRNGFATNLN